VADFKVGLLLGTSKNLKNGNKNDFFFNRIDATVQLFKSGKIKNVIISGDNSKKNYNEPLDMKVELVRNGIPDSVIYLDYAGFRTLDAVVRAKEIFGQSSYIVISQKFHNERAVYLARKYGIDAYGYNAKEVTAYKGFKTKLRELFARDKMFLDLMFGVKPKFMGERIILR
jgi:SanA protein